MNTIQAKQTIHINDFLKKNGYKPVKENSKSSWYQSPLRDEKTASFMVNIEKNTFVDWGTGKKGTIIDLAMSLYLTDISGALKKLEAYMQPGNKAVSFSFKKQKYQESERTVAGKIEKITNPQLIKYLSSRGIPKNIWENCEFLYQYVYKNTKSSRNRIPYFYNLVWKNDKCGYEKRSKYFKGAMLFKDITTIPGDKTQFNLFEGFFDYLSALVYYNRNRLPGTSIVLNSVVMVSKVLKVLNNESVINSYLDNDKTGIETFNVINVKFEKVVNKSKEIYPDYKDFNDFILR